MITTILNHFFGPPDWHVVRDEDGWVHAIEANWGPTFCGDTMLHAYVREGRAKRIARKLRYQREDRPDAVI